MENSDIFPYVVSVNVYWIADADGDSDYDSDDQGRFYSGRFGHCNFMSNISPL